MLSLSRRSFLKSAAAFLLASKLPAGQVQPATVLPLQGDEGFAVFGDITVYFTKLRFTCVQPQRKFLYDHLSRVQCEVPQMVNKWCDVTIENTIGYHDDWDRLIETYGDVLQARDNKVQVECGKTVRLELNNAVLTGLQYGEKHGEIAKFGRLSLTGAWADPVAAQCYLEEAITRDQIVFNHAI